MKTAYDRQIARDDYYLNIAEAVADKSTCTKFAYGAVLVNHDEVVATGYNGSPRGFMNCTETGCFCEVIKDIGRPFRDICVAVHATKNVLVSASRQETIGATLYIVGLNRLPEFIQKDEIYADPTLCLDCHRMAVNAGILRCVSRINDPDHPGMHINTEIDISAEHLVTRTNQEYLFCINRLDREREAQANEYIEASKRLGVDLEKVAESPQMQELNQQKAAIFRARCILDSRKEFSKEFAASRNTNCQYAREDMDHNVVCGLTFTTCNPDYCPIMAARENNNTNSAKEDANCEAPETTSN